MTAARRAWTRSAPRLHLSATAGIQPYEPTAIAGIAVLTLSLYFLAFPHVDLVIANLFYDPAHGFTLSQTPVLKALRKSSTYVLGLILLGLISNLIWRAVSGRGLIFAARRSWFLIAGLALGPGLVVNTVLKNSWGRARPLQIEQFAGNGHFTPAWVVSDDCRSNCSFVSGEGASSAWIVAAALVLTPARWRPVVVPAAVVYAIALSLNRMAFGAHFLSDILLSWALTGLVMAVLYRLMVAAPGAARLRRRRPAVALA